jgi:hypothetical protein
MKLSLKMVFGTVAVMVALPQAEHYVTVILGLAAINLTLKVIFNINACNHNKQNRKVIYVKHTQKFS